MTKAFKILLKSVLASTHFIVSMRFWQKLGKFQIDKLTLYFAAEWVDEWMGFMSEMGHRGMDVKILVISWLFPCNLFVNGSKRFSSRTICFMYKNITKPLGHRAKWIGMRSIPSSLIETSERGGVAVTGRSTQTCDKWLRRIPGDSRHRRSDSSPNNHPLTMSSFGRARTCPLTFAGNWKS